MTGGARHASVLIVEDEVAIADMLADRLAARGYRPLVAADAVSGLALARSEAPEVALVDLYMPRVDGESFVAQLRATGAGARVIVMSAALDGREAAARLEAPFLEKPFSVADVIAAIEACLA